MKYGHARAWAINLCKWKIDPVSGSRPERLGLRNGNLRFRLLRALPQQPEPSSLWGTPAFPTLPRKTEKRPKSGTDACELCQFHVPFGRARSCSALSKMTEYCANVTNRSRLGSSEKRKMPSLGETLCRKLYRSLMASKHSLESHFSFVKLTSVQGHSIYVLDTYSLSPSTDTSIGISNGKLLK